MDSNVLEQKPLIELIPQQVRNEIAEVPIVESGFGAGPGFVAVKRWKHDPPISLLTALNALEHYRELLRRCHLVFVDGSRVVMDRHQFHSFHPSVQLRRALAASVGSAGIVRERFRFDDFDEWPDTLARDIAIFKEVHGVTPNLLVTCREVYAEMDMAVQSHRDMVIDAEGKHPTDSDDFEVSGFLIEACEVEFVIGDTLTTPEYLLISDPGFDPDDGESEVSWDIRSERVFRVG